MHYLMVYAGNVGGYVAVCACGRRYEAPTHALALSDGRAHLDEAFGRTRLVSR